MVLPVFGILLNTDITIVRWHVTLFVTGDGWRSSSFTNLKACNSVISRSGFRLTRSRKRNRKSKGFGKQSIWRAELISQYLNNWEPLYATPLATDLSCDLERYKVAASVRRRKNTTALSALVQHDEAASQGHSHGGLMIHEPLRAAPVRWAVTSWPGHIIPGGRGGAHPSPTCPHHPCQRCVWLTLISEGETWNGTGGSSCRARLQLFSPLKGTVHLTLKVNPPTAQIKPIDMHNVTQSFC